MGPIGENNIDKLRSEQDLYKLTEEIDPCLQKNKIKILRPLYKMERNLLNKFLNIVLYKQKTKPAFSNRRIFLQHFFNIKKDKIASIEKFRKEIFDGKFPVKAKRKTGSGRTKTGTSGKNEEV